MDVLYFLKDRTEFIRRFYQSAGEPFRATVRKIEAGDAPFDNPPYSEDGEPPFIEEWMEASTSLQVLGRACLSMLSASLHVYFKTWEAELRIEWNPKERKSAFKKGFIQGYRTLFGNVAGISWHECPINFALLEQVTVARNRDQHPDSIATLNVRHAPADRQKLDSFSSLTISRGRCFPLPMRTSILGFNQQCTSRRRRCFRQLTRWKR